MSQQERTTGSTLTKHQWQAKFRALKNWTNGMLINDAIDLLACCMAVLIRQGRDHGGSVPDITDWAHRCIADHLAAMERQFDDPSVH